MPAISALEGTRNVALLAGREAGEGEQQVMSLLALCAWRGDFVDSEFDHVEIIPRQVWVGKEAD